MTFKSTRKTRRHKNNNQKAEHQEQPFFDKASAKDVQTKEDPFFQAKLTVGQPGDKYEKEADAVADSVVSRSNKQPAIQEKEISKIQRVTLSSPEEDEKLNTAEARMEKDKLIQEQAAPASPQEEELTQTQPEEEDPNLQTQEEEEPSVQEMHDPHEKEEEEAKVQTKSAPGAKQASNKVHKNIKKNAGRGKKLPPAVRSEMESSIGHDFSQVNIHTSKDAADMNRDLHAQAFTHGQDIYFNSGKYRPETSDGKRLLAHELTHTVQQDKSNRKGSHVQRNPESSCLEPAEHGICRTLAMAPDEADAIVGKSLIETLHRFQTIPIRVQGVVNIEGPSGARCTEQTKLINVSAHYFINTSTARHHYRKARRQQNFSAIVNALRKRKELSIIRSSKDKALNKGRAVEVGKGSPDDIKAFVEEALSQDIIKRYGVSIGAMTENQQLIDLPKSNIQILIQDWMRQTGIGVDCSGFVVQAAYHAREAIRADLETKNQSLEARDSSDRYDIAGARELKVRNAQSFTSGQEVESPIDMRPGDAWVVSNGSHIRIVTSIQQFTKGDGVGAIRFETAESSGSSKQAMPGPTRRIWKTFSIDTFEPIKRVDGSGGNVEGSFYRIP